MAAKTIISKFTLAGALGVAAATATFGPIGHSLDERLDAADLVPDERIRIESSTHVLGLSRPVRIERLADHALQSGSFFGSPKTKPQKDALTITFSIGGSGEDESNLLSKDYRSPYEVDLYADEVILGGLAVVAKVVANGLSLTDILRSMPYEGECVEAECAVFEAATEYLDRRLLDKGANVARSKTLSNRTYGMDSLNWNRDDLTGRGPVIVPQDEIIKILLPYSDDPSAKPAPEAGKESYYALSDAMDDLQVMLTDGASSDLNYGLWYVHNYEEDSSSWPTLRVLTDVIYGLSMHDAGSILFCGNEKDPVYVYEVGARVPSLDDLERFQAHYDEILSALEVSTKPPSPSDFHSGLINDDVDLDVTYIRYRDNLKTNPIILKSDKAVEFLTSCSDSLIDP